MKTKSSTKFMLVLAGSLLAVGSIQAQQTQSDSLLTLQKNAISLITGGAGNPKPGNTGFWGYAFGDYAYMGKGDSAGRGTKQQYKGLGALGNQQIPNPNDVEVRRAYLGYDMKINTKFYAYALLAYEGDQDVNNNRTVYLKYIYFKWKNIWKNTDLKVGQQATNSFASAYNTEPLLGYRAVEKTILDMHGVDGSSDMGIALEGRIWTNKNGSPTKVPTFIGYSAMMGANGSNTPISGFTGTLTNATGTATGSTLINPPNATTDIDKKFRGQLYVNTLNNHLTVGAYMDYINYGHALYNTSTNNVPNNSSSTYHEKAVQTHKIYAVYNDQLFGVGGEAFTNTMTNGETEGWATWTNNKAGSTLSESAAKAIGQTNDTTNAEQEGISLFAHATIIPGTLNVFARYDMYTPDTKYSYNTYSYTATVAGKTTTTNYVETFSTNASNVGSTSNTYNGIASSVAGNTYTESFFNLGLDWTPTKDKKVHLMPNIWYYKISNGFGSDNLASDNYMLYRVTFLFAFN